MSAGPRGEKLIQGMYTFAFSPDGTKIATASPDHNILICDVKTGICLHTFTGHTDIINTMDWRGDKIISGSEAGEVVLWDLRELDLNTVDEVDDMVVSTLNMTFLRNYDNPIKRVAFSEDGSKTMSLAISVQGMGTLSVGSTENKEQDRVDTDYYGSRMRIRDACFSPDGAYIAVAAADGLNILQLWGIKVLGSWHPNVFHLFSGDHRHVDWKKNHIATSSAHPQGASYLDTRVQVFDIIGDIRDGKYKSRIEHGQLDWTSDIELSADNTRVTFTGTNRRMVYQYDIVTHRCVEQMVHDGMVSAVKNSPDGLFICCAASDGYLHLWDDRFKRRQIIEAAIEAYVKKEYEDKDVVATRDRMSRANADFIRTEKARLEINSLREKLNGYFLPYEIHKYAKEFSLTRGLPEEYSEYSMTHLAEELMRIEYTTPVSLEYPGSAARGGGPRRRLRRRRRRPRDSLKLRL